MHPSVTNLPAPVTTIIQPMPMGTKYSGTRVGQVQDKPSLDSKNTFDKKKQQASIIAMPFGGPQAFSLSSLSQKQSKKSSFSPNLLKATQEYEKTQANLEDLGTLISALPQEEPKKQESTESLIFMKKKPTNQRQYFSNQLNKTTSKPKLPSAFSPQPQTADLDSGISIKPIESLPDL